MGTIHTPIKTISGQYNFGNDGGAIGQIVLSQEVIPARSVIFYGCAMVDTGLTSGGAAFISVDITGIVGGLIAATAVATWGANAVLEGLPLTTVSQITTLDAQLLMSISAFPLLTGIFRYSLAYFEFGREF